MAGVSEPVIRVAEARQADKDSWLSVWHAWQRHMKGTVSADVTERSWRRSQEPDSDLLILLGFTPVAKPLASLR